jgi:hypothetical protein
MILRDAVQFILKYRPGATDRQLTEAIFGDDRRHADINQVCRSLEAVRIVERRKSNGGPFQNYIVA